MSDSAISIEHVSKSFGATRAVQDLSLEVPAGSLCGFLGPNGAGKSTTIRMIMSIIYPDTGSVQVFGGSALANKDRIGYLPEERGVYKKMRVGEYLRYIAKLKNVDGSRVRTLVEEWLERVDLPGVSNKKCEELSKGMQQKVQFIASVIHSPDLLILDEPFSGLDPVNAQVINQIIRELHDSGTTIIFSTHILPQAEQICDRIFLINKGVKLLDDTLESIKAHFDPRTLRVEAMGDADVESMKAMENVVDVRPLDPKDPNGRALEVALTDDADPQMVMQSMLDLQPMRTVELRRLSLDDVFVRTVLKAGGVEAAATAREELSHVQNPDHSVS